MPVVFEPTDILYLNCYGKFTRWRYPGFVIPAANAVSITTTETNKWTEPFKGPTCYAADFFPVRPHLGIEKWGVIVEGFHWGATSTPDLVYYEIYAYGKVLPLLYEGFYCCGKIGYGDLENPSTHPTAAQKIELRFWNCSSPYPRNVWAEFACWLYWFPMENLQALLDIADITIAQEMNRRHLSILVELTRLRMLTENKLPSEIEEAVKKLRGSLT